MDRKLANLLIFQNVVDICVKGIVYSHWQTLTSQNFIVSKQLDFHLNLIKLM